MSKNNKPIKPEKRKKTKYSRRQKFHRFMMWFLAIILVASLVIPAFAGFISF